MKFFYLLLASFGVFVKFSDGLNILAILPLSMKSHYAIGTSIAKSLLEVGHNLTVISMFKEGHKLDNYREISIPDTMNASGWNEMNPLDYTKIPIILSVVMMPLMGYDMVNEIMKSEELHEFLKSDEKFDVCIMELFGTEALLGIVEKSNCALMMYTTFDAVLWTDIMMGNDSPLSYVPHPFLHYTDKMTFSERLWNGFYTLTDSFFHHALHLPVQKYLYSKHFPNARRSFDEMFKNTSLIFINNHVSYSSPRPHLPTQIEIGGIHVKPVKKLPDDFQEYLDSATDGVILFSMGSYIDGTDWSLDKREAFIRVFGKLKQKIIWRYSNETLPNNPGNIKIASWLPQRDILAHPNVKVFITHGGLLGTTEAMIESVPVLGIPIFGDQMMNMAKAVSREYGLQIRYDDITEERFSDALNELLTNPIYKKNAVRISKIFNDRSMTPQESVVYWTEYVARHHGADHLKAQSVNLNFIEYHSIDVYCVLLIITLIMLYVDYKILKFIVRKIFTKITQKKAKIH